MRRDQADNWDLDATIFWWIGRTDASRLQPPVVDMYLGTDGLLSRPMMKSWPLGFRVMASSIAAFNLSLPSESRNGARRSAESS